MTELATRALEVAARYKGTHEDPPGSNRGPLIDKWIRFVGLDPAAGSYPWCAAFGSWCIATAGDELAVRPRFRYSARCARVLALNEDLILPAPQPGAVGIHLNADHTGHFIFVVSVNADLSVETIEGNTDAAGGRTGGQVMSHRRPADYARAYLEIR